MQFIKSAEITYIISPIYFSLFIAKKNFRNYFKRDGFDSTNESGCC